MAQNPTGAQQAMGATLPQGQVGLQVPPLGGSGCVHSWKSLGLSAPPCLDGVMGLGAAAMGIVILLMGLAVLTGVGRQVVPLAATAARL